MNNTVRHSGVWTAGLIVGNLIGAGILALPVSLGLCGMIPSLFLMILYGALMFFSAEILTREAIERKNSFFDLPSLYGTYLGRWGKWAGIITNTIILYGLLTAYISGAAQIIADLTGLQGSKPLIALTVAAVLSSLSLLDLSLIHKYNAVLVGGLLCAFIALLFLSFPALEFSRLAETHWSYAPLAIPLVVTACHFHNIIPVLCKDLNWDLHAMRQAVFCGLLTAMLMNLLWTLCGIATLPRHGNNSLVLAYLSDLPATVPMGNILRSRLFTVIAAVFSLTAIATSFIATVVGLLNFLKDLFANSCRKSFRHRATLIKLLVFVPPLTIALIKPEIFIRALDVAGGIGIVTLFGILPCLIAVFKKGNSRKFRMAGIFFLLLALLAFGSACLTVAGIKPDLSPECQECHGNHKYTIKTGNEI